MVKFRFLTRLWRKNSKQLNRNSLEAMTRALTNSLTPSYRETYSVGEGAKKCPTLFQRTLCRPGTL